ncbi:MAG: hypothetical protein NT124_03670 [Candidatus Dependentiae bacterium]|nr:hypothetical protein [Candidatus Dependentiae bacterium]
MNRIYSSTQKLSLFILLSLPFSTFTYDKKYMEEVQNSNINSLGIRPEKITPPEVIYGKDGVISVYKSIFKPSPFILPELSKHEQREIIFQITEQNTYDNYSTISATTAKKMDLIANTGEKCGDHLAHRISTIIDDKNKVTPLIYTESGNCALAKKISQPNTDINTLTRRQNITKACMANSKLHADLTSTLQIMGSAENHFLSFYATQYINPAQIKLFHHWNTWPFTRLNNSADGLEIGRYVGHASQIFGISLFCTRFIRGYVKRMAQMNGDSGLEEIDQFFNKPAMKAAHYAWNMYFLSMQVPFIKFNKELLNCVQTQLIGAANYVNGAKQLYNLASKNSEIASNLESLKELKALVHRTKEHSPEFNELIELLGTDTFKGEASFFSMTGRVLRAYTLMNTESVKKEFAGVVNAVGELDVYVALAHKINTTAPNEVRYSFVEFDTTSTTPYIKATGLWNPFVNESQAVTNTIELGGAKPRNIVLNGPNTGGKSTIAKAVLLNTILAQTFGIVAAEKMVMTPFGNLDCYLNMTDDTASGVSGLKAEVNRAKELIERIKNQGNAFSFVALDEIFTATSPDQAEKLAVSFITSLSLEPNCLFINPAHFEGSVQFATQSPNCRTCHMAVITDAQGKVLKYTYKLAEGRSHVKNAAQVAQEGMAINW